MIDNFKSYQSIQALRALAAFLVVLFHLRIVEGKYGNGHLLLPEVMQFADAGVDLFFVISGFVMAVITAGRFNSIASSTQFLFRRAWRILPPYWIYTTLVVVLMAVVPSMVNSSYSNQSVLASYLLLPQQQAPLLTVGWTLIHEAYFYLVTAIAIAFICERYFPVFLALWALIIVVAQYYVDASTPLVNLVLSPMTLEFIGGALIGIYWRKVLAQLALVFIVVGFLLFGWVMAFPHVFGVQQHDPIYRVLYFGSASLLIVLGAVLYESVKKFTLPRWLQAVGDGTYSIYLSHVFVISALGRLWYLSGTNNSSGQHAFFVALTILAALGVGVLSFRFIERPLLNVQYLFNRKSQPQKPNGSRC